MNIQSSHELKQEFKTLLEKIKLRIEEDTSSDKQTLVSNIEDDYNKPRLDIFELGNLDLIPFIYQKSKEANSQTPVALFNAAEELVVNYRLKKDSTKIGFADISSTNGAAEHVLNADYRNIQDYIFANINDDSYPLAVIETILESINSDNDNILKLQLLADTYFSNKNIVEIRDSLFGISGYSPNILASQIYDAVQGKNLLNDHKTFTILATNLQNTFATINPQTQVHFTTKDIINNFLNLFGYFLELSQDLNFNTGLGFSLYLASLGLRDSEEISQALNHLDEVISLTQSLYFSEITIPNLLDNLNSPEILEVTDPQQLAIYLLNALGYKNSYMFLVNGIYDFIYSNNEEKISKVYEKNIVSYIQDIKTSQILTYADLAASIVYPTFASNLNFVYELEMDLAASGNPISKIQSNFKYYNPTDLFDSVYQIYYEMNLGEGYDNLVSQIDSLSLDKQKVSEIVSSLNNLGNLGYSDSNYAPIISGVLEVLEVPTTNSYDYNNLYYSFYNCMNIISNYTPEASVINQELASLVYNIPVSDLIDNLCDDLLLKNTGCCPLFTSYFNKLTYSYYNYLDGLNSISNNLNINNSADLASAIESIYYNPDLQLNLLLQNDLAIANVPIERIKRKLPYVYGSSASEIANNVYYALGGAIFQLI